MKRFLEETLAIIFLIALIVSICMLIEFPFRSFLALIGFIVTIKVVIRAWNCFSINVLGRGSINKEIAVANRHELPALFNRVVRDDVVKGKVEVSETCILACGCEEPLFGVKRFTAVEAQAHMQKLVSDFDIRDNSLSASNTVYFTFKTQQGRCTVSYRMIGPKSLEQERKNMITFPPSAKFNTATADSSFGVHYEGKMTEYSQLATAWGL